MLKIDVQFVARTQIEPMGLTGQCPLRSSQFLQLIFELFGTLNQQFQRFNSSNRRFSIDPIRGEVVRTKFRSNASTRRLERVDLNKRTRTFRDDASIEGEKMNALGQID